MSPGAGQDGARALGALADPTRRAVLDLLIAQGPASASALAREVDISRQALTKHLGSLVEVGVLTTQRSGREVRYVIDPATLTAASDWLDARARAWDRQLAALKRAAEAPGMDPRPTPLE